MSVSEGKEPADVKLETGVSSKDVVIDADSNVWVRIYTPTESEKMGSEGDHGGAALKKLKVLVNFHGGGFVVFSPSEPIIDRLCRKLTLACNVVVVSVAYRKAPEFRYPVACDDSYKALEWLQSSHSRSDLPAIADVSQCFLIGESAGGNIVHFVGCKAAENDLSPVRIRALVELDPFFGGEEITPAEIEFKDNPINSLEVNNSCWRDYLPLGADRDHPACNVLGPNCVDISGLSLPPILVVIPSQDILKDWQARYVDRLAKLGKDVEVLRYPGATHGFLTLSDDELARRAMADVAEFIRSHSTE